MGQCSSREKEAQQGQGGAAAAASSSSVVTSRITFTDILKHLGDDDDGEEAEAQKRKQEDHVTGSRRSGQLTPTHSQPSSDTLSSSNLLACLHPTAATVTPAHDGEHHDLHRSSDIESADGVGAGHSRHLSLSSDRRSLQPHLLTRHRFLSHSGVTHVTHQLVLAGHQGQHEAYSSRGRSSTEVKTGSGTAAITPNASPASATPRPNVTRAESLPVSASGSQTARAPLGDESSEMNRYGFARRRNQSSMDGSLTSRRTSSGSNSQQKRSSHSSSDRPSASPRSSKSSSSSSSSSSSESESVISEEEEEEEGEGEVDGQRQQDGQSDADASKVELKSNASLPPLPSPRSSSGSPHAMDVGRGRSVSASAVVQNGSMSMSGGEHVPNSAGTSSPRSASTHPSTSTPQSNDLSTPTPHNAPDEQHRSSHSRSTSDGSSSLTQSALHASSSGSQTARGPKRSFQYPTSTSTSNSTATTRSSPPLQPQTARRHRSPDRRPNLPTAHSDGEAEQDEKDDDVEQSLGEYVPFDAHAAAAAQARQQGGAMNMTSVTGLPLRVGPAPRTNSLNQRHPLHPASRMSSRAPQHSMSQRASQAFRTVDMSSTYVPTLSSGDAQSLEDERRRLIERQRESMWHAAPDPTHDPHQPKETWELVAQLNRGQKRTGQRPSINHHRSSSAASPGQCMSIAALNTAAVSLTDSRRGSLGVARLTPMQQQQHGRSSKSVAAAAAPSRGSMTARDSVSRGSMSMSTPMHAQSRPSDAALAMRPSVLQASPLKGRNALQRGSVADSGNGWRARLSSSNMSGGTGPLDQSRESISYSQARALSQSMEAMVSPRGSRPSASASKPTLTPRGAQTARARVSYE